MKRTIFSLGGVVSVDGDLSPEATDAEIIAFLESSVVYAEGRLPITPAELREQYAYMKAFGYD